MQYFHQFGVPTKQLSYIYTEGNHTQATVCKLESLDLLFTPLISSLNYSELNIQQWL
jgi:hypothetical protein